MVAPLNACMRDRTWFNRDTNFLVIIQTVLFQRIVAAGRTWSWHSTCKRNAFFKAVWSILFDCLSTYSYYNSLILQLCVQTELYKVGTMGYRVCDTWPADLTNHTTEQIISSGSHWWTTGRIVSNPVDWDVSLAYVTCILYVVYKYARIVSLLDWKISTKIIKLLNYCGEDPVCASDDKVSDTALQSILWNLCANHWVFISFDETKRFLVMKLIAVHVKLAKGDPQWSDSTRDFISVIRVSWKPAHD